MLRSVDPQEAKEVLRLATMRQSAAASDGPTVEGLAEHLNLPVSEVERLLAEVRNRKFAAPRSFGDRSAALSAALVLALVVTLGLIGGGIYWARTQSGADSSAVLGAGGLVMERDVPYVPHIPPDDFDFEKDRALAKQMEKAAKDRAKVLKDVDRARQEVDRAAAALG